MTKEGWTVTEHDCPSDEYLIIVITRIHDKLVQPFKRSQCASDIGFPMFCDVILFLSNNFCVFYPRTLLRR
jgi:hypothetical protein